VQNKGEKTMKKVMQYLGFIVIAAFALLVSGCGPV